MGITDFRYQLAKRPDSKRIGIVRVEEIAALLNARKIDDSHVAAEYDLYGPDEPKWMPVSELLKAAYKDKPLVTVVIIDAITDACILSERYHTDDGPWQVAFAALDLYVAEHVDEFGKGSTKDFNVYFKSEKCPPTAMTVTLKMEQKVVEKRICGADEGFEEIHPYHFDESPPRNIKPDEFPSVSLESKSPKYDPSVPLPRFVVL